MAQTSILLLGASLELLLETSMAVLHHFFRIIICTSVGTSTGNLTGNVAGNNTMNSTVHVSLLLSASVEQFHVHIYIISP